MTTSMNDNSLIAFKAISNFTSELGELFGKRQKSLRLYCRLIEKTTISNDKPILKHIGAFRKFCVENKDSIMKKETSFSSTPSISYSDNVYINMKDIFKLVDDDDDNDTRHAIWNHLLTIMALVDPSSNAKEILKKSIDSEGNESKFLTDIVSKVESVVDPNTSNPMEAVSSLMSSGVFTDLLGSMSSGINNGELDLGKLMGVVQSMAGNLSETTGGDANSPNPMAMLTTMLGSLNNK